MIGTFFGGDVFQLVRIFLAKGRPQLLLSVMPSEEGIEFIPFDS